MSPSAQGAAVSRYSDTSGVASQPTKFVDTLEQKFHGSILGPHVPLQRFSRAITVAIA